MRKSDWLYSFVVIAALSIVGCEKKEGAAPSTTTPPPAPAGTAGPSAPATPSAATPAPAAPSIPMPNETPTTAAVSSAAAAAASQPAAATAEAQKLLDQAMNYVKENKLDLAEKAVTQLEGMKASLPAAMQTQVDNARKMLNTAKAAGAVKVPALPGASQ
jgi:hypothetical protein